MNESVPANAHTVTVTGTGSVATAPDYFHINIGIEAQRPTVREAYAAAGAALAAISARLLELHVPRDVIGSSALDVRAETRWQDGAGSLITGYTVSSTLNVMLRYDEAAADIVAAVVDAGNNSVRLNGLTPAVSDPSATQDAARALAWADAQRSALLYAELAGRTLGRAVAIVEGPERWNPPMPFMARAAVNSDAALAVEPGQRGVSAAVTVTWELI